MEEQRAEVMLGQGRNIGSSGEVGTIAAVYPQGPQHGRAASACMAPSMPSCVLHFRML